MIRIGSALFVLVLTAATAGQQRTYLILGRVVAADGRAPVAGAQVSLSPTPQGAITRTGPDGRFEFRSDDAEPALTITKTGFVLERISGRSSPMEIRLRRGAALTVQAVGPGGEPAAGAQIHVQCGNSGTGGPADDRGIRRVPYLAPGRCQVSVDDDVEPVAPLRRGAPPADRRAALERARGRLEQRRRQAVTVNVRAGEEASLVVKSPLQVPLSAHRRDEIPLPGGNRPSGSGMLEGRVLGPDARPLEGALVFLTAVGGPVMVTGSDGAFTFANLPQERYRMRAEKPGFVTREHGQGEALDDIGTSVTLGDGQHLRGIDIVLPKGSVVSGRVRDGQGEPMADARVWLIPAQGARTLAPPSSSIPGLIRTDDRGYYRIPGVLAGVYHVAAQLIVLPQPIMPRQGSFSWTPPSVEPTTLVDVPAGTEVEGIDALGIVSEYSSRPLQVPGR